MLRISRNTIPAHQSIGPPSPKRPGRATGRFRLVSWLPRTLTLGVYAMKMGIFALNRASISIR